MTDLKSRIEAELNTFIKESPKNIVPTDKALSEAQVGLKIYESATVRVADADDPYFLKLKEPGIVGAHLKLPQEWLPEARSVICFMLYYSKEVRYSNSRDSVWPSNEWMHGRIEGHEMIMAAAAHVESYLKGLGLKALSPQLDARIGPRYHFDKVSEDLPRFNSFWSERHAAYIAGLGTFGLSKGLISEKGMAGRLCSVLTDAVIEPDQRPYTDIYEYCTKCGACIKRCPVNAITFEQGKDHAICSGFLDSVLKEHNPYYGCGKCQVGVPCENKAPGRESIQ